MRNFVASLCAILFFKLLILLKVEFHFMRNPIAVVRLKTKSFPKDPSNAYLLPQKYA